MRLLESSASGIREELESIGFAKWSRAYSPCRRYNVMTTNISESLNSAMLKARELPMCSMLEALRMMLQRWFFEWRNDAEYQVTDFTKTIESILRKQIELSRSVKVNPVNNMKYQVIDGISQYVIYLPTKVCSCRMWDILEIPCAHVCAVFTMKHFIN
ncbi:uncharacterized protein E5676_scaffold25G00510 [Cucumis melo var. makuwa]|uniref:SWIM-type domain-containing protein n=1 Tax=Cucumis melo var. makuwa TaxID=1194695 RepID=A0A5D3CGP0_CUCMM|nr:uncharacterized protein E6C27_scaffold1593G00110 [Cucumis melo var. makuwa]TYK10685.1 uncharacterized protein E5676_scaffold25G00510 [Cucumis melo var. makuwa]